MRYAASVALAAHVPLPARLACTTGGSHRNRGLRRREDRSYCTTGDHMDSTVSVLQYRRAIRGAGCRVELAEIVAKFLVNANPDLAAVTACTDREVLTVPAPPVQRVEPWKGEERRHVEDVEHPPPGNAVERDAEAIRKIQQQVGEVGDPQQDVGPSCQDHPA